jgi:hypothetical protein
VSESRVDFGPDYRTYFSQKGQTLVIRLCGGDERTPEQYVRLDPGFFVSFVLFCAFPEVRHKHSNLNGEL